VLEAVASVGKHLRLIEMGRIDQMFADKVCADLASTGENPNALMITPLVVEIVAEKRNNLKAIQHPRRLLSEPSCCQRILTSILS